MRMKSFVPIGLVIFFSILPALVGCGSSSSSSSSQDAGPDADTDADTDSDADNDSDSDSDTDSMVNISLQSQVTDVQPMTGIVFWNDQAESSSDVIQLEYSYMAFDDVAVDENPAQWDWSGVEQLLDDIESHGHQGILRFYYVYPGESTTVPSYIKILSDYNETSGLTEGQTTYFPDWSHTELKDFTKEFYTEFAGRYDHDPRIAFLEVGFGLWGEYHVYEPGLNLGVNFPDKAYQEEFILHLESAFSSLHWAISIDAADGDNTPFESTPTLIDVPFGLFDDSFLNEHHHQYNKDCFDFFGQAKRLESPIGGEFSYYTAYDQQHALDLPGGPHGVSYEQLAADYNVTFMIGADQPQYQTDDRIRQAGIASGYHFAITSFKSSSTQSEVAVRNDGIAPIYYDAFVAVNGVRSSESLKNLLPGESKTYSISSGGTDPTLTIECDRLVPGQEIQFDAAL